MDRFFAEGFGGPGARVVLSPEETRHVKVRRVSPGEEVALFDGAGHEASARFAGLDGRRAVLELVEVRPAPPDVRPLVAVASAIPKGRRMADLVRACTEVGAWKILPLLTDRSAVHPKKTVPNERWARIAREAAKQSRRSHVPEVAAAAGLEKVLAGADGYDLRLLADARAGSTPIREALRDEAGVQSALVLVGPEGGFTEAEIERAASRGFVPVHLPGPVMRVETAAPVMVATILFACSPSGSSGTGPRETGPTETVSENED